MSLGYLLAKSDIALETFLRMLFCKGDVKKLMSYKCVVDCEMINPLPNRKSQRADIVLRFYSNYCPEHAIIIEAKSACARINNQCAASQAKLISDDAASSGLSSKVHCYTNHNSDRLRCECYVN